MKIKRVNKVLIIFIIFVNHSCYNDVKYINKIQTDLRESSIEYYKEELLRGNIYFFGIDTLGINRKDEILYEYFGLIWKENIMPKRDSSVKYMFDSIIYNKFNISANDILYKIKNISDSMDLMLLKNQCLNGNYYYSDTMPKLIVSKDSLNSVFTLVIDTLKEELHSIFNISIDTLGTLSNSVLVKRVNTSLDSLAIRKILHQKLWKSAWINGEKVKFCLKNIHFNYIPTRRRIKQ